jgi:hypothetical protein
MDTDRKKAERGTWTERKNSQARMRATRIDLLRSKRTTGMGEAELRGKASPSRSFVTR